MAQRAVHDGLFDPGPPPTLLGSHCGTCDAYRFPRTETCSQCGFVPTDPVDLDGRGTLWAWTAVTAPPPGYSGPVPYGFGVVELDLGTRVVARLTEANPDNLSVGTRMRLVVVPVGVDDKGDELLSYAYEPV